MGSDLTDFLAQLPFGLILTVCGSGILLVVVMSYIVAARARRTKAQTPQPPAYAGAPTAAGLPQTGDLPDLDMLVDISSMREDTPSPAAAPPPPPRPARKGTHTITTSDDGEAEAVEVMVIMRDVVDGRLVVQMGDKLYKNVHTDADFKDKFTKLMRELAQAVQTRPAAPPAPSAPSPESPPPTVPDSAPPVQQDVPKTPPRKVENAPPPPIAPDGTMPGDLPSFRIADQKPIQTRKRGQKPDIQPVSELDIAGAIEAYLQHKLRHTPDYAERSIHVYPSPDGGVRIEVDGQFYEGVSDIGDDGVREFMQQTIQEWQDRH
jgi:hypothetical protein